MNKRQIWLVFTTISAFIAGLLFLNACDREDEHAEAVEDESVATAPEQEDQGAAALHPQQAFDNRVKFAHVADSGVQIALLGADGIENLERLEVELRPIALRWLDGDLAILTTRAVRGEPPEHHLYIYEDGELSELELPDAEAWHVPHDQDYSAYERGGAFVDSAGDELWIRRCLGGYLGDANGCNIFTYVRILPSVIEAPATPPMEHISSGIRFVDEPQVASVEVVFDKDDPNWRTVLCRSNGGGSSELRGNSFEPAGNQLRVSGGWFVPSRVHWISQNPPVYVVSQSDESGEAIFDRYILFTPCEDQPHFERLVSETDFVYGPEGVWAAGHFLYFEGRLVAEFDGTYLPRYNGPVVAFLDPDPDL